MGLSHLEVTMLEDAYESVSSANQWEWLKNNTIESFMFGEYLELKHINNFMKFSEHSGFSYAWTMRHIEYLAKYGMEAYVDKFKRAKSVLNAK